MSLDFIDFFHQLNEIEGLIEYSMTELLLRRFETAISIFFLK